VTVLAVSADTDTTSPLGVLRENVVLLLRNRVAREPTLGVVPLGRLIRLCGALAQDPGLAPYR